MLKFKSDSVFYKLFASSFAVLVVKVTGAALGFLVSVLIARSLGPTEAGVYFLFITSVTFFSTVSRGGADATIVKLVGKEIEQNNFSHSNNYSIFFLLMVTGSTLILGAFLYFFYHVVTALNIFNYSLNYNIVELIFCSLLLNLLIVLSQIFLGLRLSMTSIVTSSVIYQGVLLLILLFEKPNDARLAISLFYISLAVAFLIAAAIFIGKNFVYFRKIQLKKLEYKSIYRSMMPLFICSIAGQVAQWSPQLFLGVYAETYDVSMLAIAQRVSMVLSFILIAVNYSVANQIINAHSNGDTERLKSIVRNSGRIMLVFSSPLFILCIFFSDNVVSIFGAEYLPASIALVILVIGQFTNIITGPTGYLLVMTNNERSHRDSQIIAAICCLVSCFILIPYFAFVGAAIAVAIGVVCQNVFAVFAISKSLNINVLRVIWSNK